MKEAVTPTVNTTINLSEATHHKAMVCMLHAHIHHIIVPGTYVIELNRMLEKNGMEKMWFPPNPNSVNLLHATSTPELTHMFQARSESLVEVRTDEEPDNN